MPSPHKYALIPRPQAHAPHSKRTFSSFSHPACTQHARLLQKSSPLQQESLKLPGEKNTASLRPI
ncbi:hypothetical protein BC826DRAFT_995893 [Russula brevipes]|nr:hypothetical protein BC826DRAFT_995893 [Russula brevipes]